jgi:hypothetical protein
MYISIYCTWKKWRTDKQMDKQKILIFKNQIKLLKRKTEKSHFQKRKLIGKSNRKMEFLKIKKNCMWKK